MKMPHVIRSFVGCCLLASAAGAAGPPVGAAEVAPPQHRQFLNDLRPEEIVVPYRQYRVRGVDDEQAARLVSVALAAMVDGDRGEVTLLSAVELDAAALGLAPVADGNDLRSAAQLEAQGMTNLDVFAHEVDVAVQTRAPARYLVKLPARTQPSVPAAGLPRADSNASQAPMGNAPPPAAAGGKAITSVLFVNFDNASLGRLVPVSADPAYQWATTTCASRSGSRSADGVRGGSVGGGLGCTAAYPNSVATFMFDGQCADVLNAPEAWLELYIAVATEANFDRLFVGFSQSSDPYDVWWGYAYWGNWQAWTLQRLDMRNWYELGDLTTRSCNRLGIDFRSDGSITPGFGARIDDLHLYKGTSAPSCPTVRIAQIDTSTSPNMKAFVSALDGQGAPIASLTAANFCLREDGTSKPISVVPVSGSGTRLNMAINIDNSGSLGATNFNLEKAAAKTLIDLLASNDQAAVYGFADDVTLVANFTTNKVALKAAIDQYPYDGGNTALYDSIYESLSNTVSTSGRKAVLAMTDGENNRGSITQAEVIAHARALGIPIYTVGFGSANATVLNQLATQTGGRYYPSASAANLSQVLADIGNNVNNQYQLSYSTSRLDGLQHSVEVCLDYAGCLVTDSMTITYPNASSPCVPDATTLCIDDQPGDRRFKVQVTYATAQGGGLSGNGRAIPLSTLGVNRGGLFWFFAADNPEMLIKVLNGCGVNGYFWMFSSAGTNVGTVATVTDTRNGGQRIYSNADLTPVPTRQDTSAFSCN